MTTRIIPVDDFDLVIFGATGDLSQRKLLPALFHRDEQGQLPPGACIIGTSRKAMSHDDFRAFAAEAIASHVKASEAPKEVVDRFLARLRYYSAEATKDDGWIAIDQELADRKDVVRVFYLAVGPDLFGAICERLGQHGLVTPKSRVVVEKPLGKSGESAEALNTVIGKVFPEPAIYRIDHYLGKETVQNLMALRFANVLFEPLWNHNYIDHVQITVAETLGVEGRAGVEFEAHFLRGLARLGEDPERLVQPHRVPLSRVELVTPLPRGQQVHQPQHDCDEDDDTTAENLATHGVHGRAEGARAAASLPRV